MSFSQKFKKMTYALTSRTAMLIIGFLALSLLIWFGGPLIAVADYVPLASIAARLLTILLILLLFSVTKIYRLVQQNKRDEKMADELIDSDDSGGSEVNEEITTLKTRMNEAIDLLKDVKLFKGKNIYQLPWYIMIGPPGAGKTTVINNSGLDYPLKDKLGVDLVHGIGGTRNCDWWFTNKAVLIDTAGRYTTQNSHAKHDSRAWEGFLGLLRKYRPLRPINGVMISMGISELMSQTKTERNLHARAIKQRLQELQNQLGMTFPVYVIFSKVDLIEGFREFFGELTEEECEQVWGVTFELDLAKDTQVEAFNKEFHTLISKLTEMLNRRLINERNEAIRAKIFEFPRQLRVLQGVADGFLKEIFTPNAYEELPMFRGVYLTSATQEGTPSSFLNDVNSGKTDYINQSKSFFIKNVLESVIFPEQNLASTNKHHDKQNKWLRVASISLAVIALFGFSISWYFSFAWNSNLIAETEEAISTYQELDSASFDRNNLVVLNDRLNALRNLPASAPFLMDSEESPSFGFNKLNEIKASSVNAYDRSLQTYLEPFISNTLIKEMAAHPEHLSYLYETLKCYLMLFQPEYFESEDITAWFDAYLERNLPGDKSIQIRDELMGHISALLNKGINQTDVDNQAVRTARAELTKLPIAERAYQRLQADFLNSSIPPFRLTDIISFESAQKFTFRNNGELTRNIPGLYTFNGFHGIFNVEKSKMLGNLMASSWVYGEEASGTYDISKDEIEKKLEQRYFQDYIHYWQSFLDDLSLNQYSSPAEGVNITDVLAGSEAPIKNIITAVQKNVQLTKLPVSENQKAAGKLAANAAEIAMQTKANRIKRFLPDEAPKFDIKLPGYQVEEAFEDVINIDSQQLDNIQKNLRELNIYLTKLDRGDQLKYSIKDQISGKSKPSFIRQLEFQSRDLPYPFNSWLLDISRDTSNITKNSANRHLNEIWKSKVLREYNAAIVGRYPFSPQADKEVNMKDFARFFGPGGTIDSFFNSYVAPSVDISSSPWKFEKDIGISSETLKMFEHAYQIQTAFFDGGSNTPRIEFGLRTFKLDKTVSSLMIEIDGQSMTYRHGPLKVTNFIWPGASGQSKTRVVFTPPNGGRSINTTYQGEWSLYRMLDELSEKRSQTRNDLELHFSIMGNNAKVELLPKSIRHPFWNTSVEKFSCPTRL
ncbi:MULTISPECIES: type VI secretion system membrane subunit TssM [Pseudoalteromonas]|uniref:Type VI secretion system membrane subunit TssM n=1 Tax=Pseudoalteromonas fuliginea TaxID=1872678 RepID=A0ABQ6RI67_9GAMM|nr:MULTISPECIES: type VI secretion system membrane subunit TssM [Pseudoalteromonas]ATG79547.1 type VI secretion protein VasK [Pseudoalteromonas sp. 1_2015MBL_MicDiv]KAA1156194.1 type VI secretion system membrane subunit TssM [Pseudoalteromonas fuliginea]KAA1167383.1 type VI secretion system membrane subunit TssM [Pseudoalteromonas fuliginea]